ncbi:MAG: ABC transporter substrate-binding protein [Spirochaetaceae bacterium]|jgi:iron complex transport system substrate-binding protein|nr:ABC transporter substrate-binding protein [Spirochaetaceae bacterium]
MKTTARFAGTADKRQPFTAVLAAAVFVPAALFFALADAGCSRQAVPRAAAVRTVTDPMGFTVTLPVSPERIISSAPSNTEIITGLGLGEKIAAIDRYSLDVEGVGAGIPAIDFMYPDAEAIIALKPDLIIASEHNMVAGDDPFKLLKDMGIAVAYLPTSGGIEEIYRDITFIAELLGVPERGEQMKKTMKADIEEVTAVGRTIQQKKTVFFEISPLPHIVSFGKDTFLDEMIGIIGAENIFADQTGWIAPGGEAIIERNPDVILTNTAETGAADPVTEIMARPGFNRIRAVQNGAVYRIDGNSSSRPAPGIVRALREMARAVYPEYYD